MLFGPCCGLRIQEISDSVAQQRWSLQQRPDFVGKYKWDPTFRQSSTDFFLLKLFMNSADDEIPMLLSCFDSGRFFWFVCRKNVALSAGPDIRARELSGVIQVSGEFGAKQRFLNRSETHVSHA